MGGILQFLPLVERQLTRRLPWLRDSRMQVRVRKQFGTTREPYSVTKRPAVMVDVIRASA